MLFRHRMESLICWSIDIGLAFLPSPANIAVAVVKIGKYTYISLGPALATP